MLTRIRESFLGWKAVALLVLLSASFVFFGVQMSFSGAAYVARVNGEDISPFEVQEYYNRQANNYRQQFGELPPQLSDMLRNTAVEQVITNKVIETYLDKQRFAVSDESVQQTIRDEPSFAEDGKFSYEVYRSQLSLIGQVPAGYERDLRDALRFEQLQSGLAASAFVTPSELRRFIEISYETRTAHVASLPLAAFMPQDPPADDAIAEYYASNEAEFQSPESASLEYIELTPSIVADALNVDEAVLRSYYDNNTERFTTPAERNPRHILVPIDDDEDAALELANELYERASGGEDFAALASEYSKDGGSAARGGDLGWVRPGQFVGAVDEAVFAMTEGEIRGPVKSEFGYHIVRLDGIREGGVSLFDEVRADVEREYREQQGAEQFSVRSNRLADTLFDNPDLASLAESQGLAVQTIDDFTRASAGIFLNNETVLDTVFGPDAIRGDALSDTIELTDDRLVVLRVVEYREAATQALAEVRERIVETLNREAALEAQQQFADTLVDGPAALDAQAFTAAVTDAGGEFLGELALRRNDEEADASLVRAVFAVDPQAQLPMTAAVAGAGDTYFVYRLDAIAAGKGDDLSAAEREGIRAQLARQMGEVDLRNFVTALRESATIKLGSATIQTADDF